MARKTVSPTKSLASYEYDLRRRVEKKARALDALDRIVVFKTVYKRGPSIAELSSILGVARETTISWLDVLEADNLIHIPRRKRRRRLEKVVVKNDKK